MLYWLAEIKIREQLIHTGHLQSSGKMSKKNHLSWLMRIKWSFKIISMNESHIWLMKHGCLNILPHTLQFLRRWTFPSCLFTSVCSLYWSEQSTVYNNNLLFLLQALFTSTQESAPMENPRKAPGHPRTRTSPQAPKIFQFPQAQTTPRWWSWDRSQTSGKSQTRKRSTRDFPFPPIWRSRRTSFLARQSRLLWRDLCQGGSGYLLDISLRLRAQIIFPFTDFSFLLKTSRYDLLRKILLFQFNFRKIKPFEASPLTKNWVGVK